MSKLKKSTSDSLSEKLVCTCNKVSRAQIEGVIVRGCRTLPKIFTATTAGVGQCGGSCRPTLQKMLDCYLRDGSFTDTEAKSKK